MIDIHSHVIPVVDDGCNDFQTGYDTIKSAYEEGITDVILTPHMISNKYVHDIDKLKEAFNQFAKSVNETVPIRLHMGNELYIDHDLDKLVQSGRACTLNGTDYVLVEVPLRDKIYYDWYDDELKKLKDAGYKVIVAHPERYVFNDLDEIIERWLANGYYLQTNQDSLFSECSYLALKLIREGKISLVASDSHIRLRRPVSLKAAYDCVCLRIGKDTADLLFDINPSKVLNNQDL